MYLVPDRENTGVAAFLRGYLRAGMVMLDVGANVGDLTAIAADSVGSRGRVIAFEASPDNARMLRDRFRGIAHVEVRHAAVTDRSGMVDLHLDVRSSKRHSLYAAAVSVRGETIAVPGVRLDEAGALPRIDAIKIDAQGAEARILAGARTLLQRDRPVIVFELWPMGMAAADTAPEMAFALLAELGYRCYRLSAKGALKSMPAITRFLADASRWKSANVVALPPRPRATLLERLRERLRRR